MVDADPTQANSATDVLTATLEMMVRIVKIDEDDLITERTKIHYSLNDWKKTWMGHLGNNVIFISAIEKSNIDQLKKLLYSKVREIHITRFPYNNFLYPEIN